MAQPDFVPRFGYQHPDLNDEPRPDPFVEADYSLSRRIAEIIERHYFGQPFMVKVSHEQGIVQIQIPALMGAINWFVVHIADLSTDPGLKRIVQGCGDILERFSIPRSAYSREDYITALQAVPLLTRAGGYGNLPG